jgi:hypothetical protein
MNEPEHLELALLNEYLDQALDAGQQRMVEHHLETCVECRARLGELRQLFISIEALPEISLERDLSAGVMAQIRRQPKKQVSTWSGLTFVAQTAAAIAILAAVWPITAGEITGLPEIKFNSLAGPLTASLIEIMRFWSTETQQFLQAIQQSGYQNLDWMRQLLTSNQPAFLAWTTCLGVTFFLWLVGNVLLLRSQKPNINRRKS